jgi:hypothetical protein
MGDHRLAYLDAMEIDCWVPRRQPQAEAARIRVGPGDGGVLLLCEEPGQSATPLAADVARFLGSGVTWGWPGGQGTPGGGELTLKDAIDQRLFTRVVFFGRDLMVSIAGPDAPPVLGSAELIDAGDMDRLSASGTARKALWARMNGSA